MAQKPPTMYSQSIRTFALTLNVLSPRAYNYIRQKFNNNIPHPSTLRKWYANSSSNGQPGLSADSLQLLSKLAEKFKSEGSILYVSLSFDEMNIRRHVQYCDASKKFVGNITYGSVPRNAKYFPVANNAIVFMVNGINVKFNIPVAMHFINCLQSHEKAALISIVVEALTKIGLKIIVVLFDGLGTNIPACNLLGACLNSEKDFRPYILNPVNKEKIFIMFDPPHMIKLVRNCIGTKKVMYCKDSKIEWKFYENLEYLRAKKDIVTHKLNKEHILFEKNIMNVSLATQLLSESVALAIEKFALVPETKDLFEGAKPTADFTRRWNNLFDIFNSRTDGDNIFKKPIDSTTKNEIFSYLDETEDYIRQLKLEPDGPSILSSRRKTAFKGFIVNIRNLKEIYTTYVKTNKISSLRTKLVQQDPLENFFGRNRSCLGSNDNPTVEQFISSYRKTMVCTELRCPTLSNCIDELSILQVPSSQNQRTIDSKVIVRVDQTFRRSRKRNFSAMNCVEEIENMLLPENVDDNFDPHSFGSNITVCHVSATIESKIEKTIRTNCKECENILKGIFKENVKYSSENAFPCQSTVDICTVSNTILRRHAFKFDFNYSLLLQEIEENLDPYDLFNNSDFSHNEQHKTDLIRYIIEHFVRVRATYIARSITLNEKKKLMRRKQRKAVHFNGE